jgi:hypothetical protein
MINSVRNTVLSVLNKNNYGYISPSDFNLYAKQAQLEIFENYFSDYNTIVNKENSRMSGTDYANKKKAIEEAMETFSVTDYLAFDSVISYSQSNGRFFLPSLIYNNNDYFMINKVVCYPVTLASGSNGTVVVNQLQDSSANFILSSVQEGDIVLNETTQQLAYVESVSTTILLLDSDIFTSSSNTYYVFSARTVREAEKVTHGKITMLNNSMLTSPTINFPAYTQEYETMTLFPSDIRNYGQVKANYFRYPFDPKWTYVTLVNGEPSFDQTQPDYQDFELPIEDEKRLIVKILQYCGISIREGEVYQFAKAEETQDKAQ